MSKKELSIQELKKRVKTILTPFLDRPWILGVSGGRDSLVLLHMVHTLGKKNVTVAHVNYHLRKESTKDQKFVERIAEEYGYKVRVYDGKIKEKKGNTEDWARKLRYGFFAQLHKDEPDAYIVTAHHAGDQAETILLHLFRGAGAEGVVGMKQVKDKHIRPLLTLTGEEIALWAKQYNVRYREDSTNKDVSFARNRIRHRILPEAKLVNEGVEETLRIHGSYMDELLQWGEEVMYASSLWKRWKKTGEIPAETFFKKSEFERLWYLRLLWKELYGDTKECYRAHLYEVDKALRKKGKKEFGKVWWILREGKEIRVQEKRAKTITPATEVLHEGVPCLWGGVLWTWKREKTLPKKAQKPHILFLSSSTPIQCMVRAKKEGDRFHPLGAPGTKKVSDFLREQGIPVSKRTTVPLWQNQKGDILGVGLMPDERYKVRSGKKYYYSIEQTTL